MAQRPRLAKVAVVRGEFALLVFQKAAKDNVITGEELPTVVKAIENWWMFTKATNAAETLGDAVKRGIGDEAYREELVEDYFAAIDELPPAA